MRNTGVISRGHALTRFFQRDSTKAGQLKLYENKKKEFWQYRLRFLS